MTGKRRTRGAIFELPLGLEAGFKTTNGFEMTANQPKVRKNE